MNVNEKRRARKLLKSNRVKLLNDLKQLEKQLTIEKSPDRYKELQLEIYDIGKQLNSLVLVSVKDFRNPNEKEFEPEELAGAIEPQEIKIDVYYELKQKGWSDKKIAHAHGRTKYYVDCWKRDNDISVRRSDCNF